MKVKSLIAAKIAGKYDILGFIRNPEPENKKYKILVNIAHDSMQKDVWITAQGIDCIIDVPFSHMGREEQFRWIKYLDKKDV